VLAEAQVARERILAGARAECEAARERRLDLERRMARAERSRRENDARLAGLKALADARSELVGAAFARAEAELGGLRATASYPGVLRCLLVEAASMIAARPLVVEVDPRDEEVLRRLAAAEGLEVEVAGSLHCAGGLVARDLSGGVLVHNTLEARLRKAREALPAEATSAVELPEREGTRGARGPEEYQAVEGGRDPGSLAARGGR
ncbi:MAG TPA: V-type ATP synthase subunit E family protein, partial [Solirubrobacterales bacterium]